MVSVKKIFVLLLVCAYPFAMQEDCFARKKHSSRSSKKSKAKKRTASKSNVEKVTKETSNNTEEVAEISNTNTETVQTSSVKTTTSSSSTATTNTSTETASSEGDEVGSGAAKEVKDMSKDEKWEDFRLCMQTSCAGSDEQPNNVECYKSLNFDNAFMNCKMLVDENKREDFKNYFTGPFIRAEKKEFCEGDFYGGKFDEVTGKCAITVKYTRPSYSGKQFKCDRESRSLVWYIDNRNYVCDASLFGVGNCYQDSANYTSAQIKKWTGVAQLAVGTVMGVTAGVTAGMKNVKEEVTTKDADGNYRTENVTVKNADGTDKKAGKLEGISAGLQASSGMLSTGGTDLATALILEKEKGDRIFGVCNLPNGETIPEGNSKKLSW